MGSVDYERINNTLGKMRYYLSTHESICVSVSGGSDSDIIVHIIATHFRDMLPKINFVFSNTGIEYRATLQHLDDLRNKYGITIDEVHGMPIPIAVRKYGVPFISKRVSDCMSRLQKHDFRYEDMPLDELLEKYPRNRASLRWWTNDWGDKSHFNIDWNSGLKEYLKDQRPSVCFSSMCCDVSKKAPLKKYQKEKNCDLYITGERKSEGGARSTRHSNCFEQSHGLDHYMPLWFWNDETKAYYEKHENIHHSDCYEVYGLKRTGCVGCPFGQNVFEELEIMQKHEPQCFKLCMNVFGDSYALTREYKEHRKERSKVERDAS